MKALTWHGKHDIRCDSVPDPKIEHPRDAIIKVTACAICGSDLHIYNGIIPRMESGDVIGHETMGLVVDVGSDNNKLKIGDRVVVPFTISCGECFFCKTDFIRAANAAIQIVKRQRSCGATRLPACSVIHICAAAMPAGRQNICASLMRMSDRRSSRRTERRAGSLPVGHLSDRLHGRGVLQYQRRRNDRHLGLRPCRSIRDPRALLLGAGRVIAVDTVPERLAACARSGAETINFLEDDVYDVLMQKTKGGRDACIDAVGTEADPGAVSIHAGTGSRSPHSWARTGRTYCGRRSIAVGTSEPSRCRRLRRFPRQDSDGFGHQSRTDFPNGANAGSALHATSFEIDRGRQVDPSFVITHVASLDKGPELYKTFRDKKDGCIKVVLKPGMTDTVQHARNESLHV